MLHTEWGSESGGSMTLLSSFAQTPHLHMAIKPKPPGSDVDPGNTTPEGPIFHSSQA